MIMKRIRITVGDARFEPATEVRCATNKPLHLLWDTTSLVLASRRQNQHYYFEFLKPWHIVVTTHIQERDLEKTTLQCWQGSRHTCSGSCHGAFRQLIGLHTAARPTGSCWGQQAADGPIYIQYSYKAYMVLLRPSDSCLGLQAAAWVYMQLLGPTGWVDF